MKCSILRCHGEYDERLISNTYAQDDKTIVVRDIPAEVCNVCGDTLLRPEVVKAVDRLLDSRDLEPEEYAPVYRLRVA